MDIKKITEEMKLKIYNDENYIQAKILKTINYKIIELNGDKLKVFSNGVIYRWYLKHQNFILKKPYWKHIENIDNHYGYNVIRINKKTVRRHRIIAYTFLNLDINNTKLQIDHIDGDRLNNNINNLRIVNNQQNSWNRTKTKGYTYTKYNNKFVAQLQINGKHITLGNFDTKEEAHQAYLEGKKLYHIIQSS